MNGNESTGSAGKNPANSIDDDRVTTVFEEESGMGRATIEGGEPAESRADIIVNEDGNGHLWCAGYWFVDQPPEVALSLVLPNVDANVTMTPARARELAAELQLAAMHAEQGAREAGWSE